MIALLSAYTLQSRAESIKDRLATASFTVATEEHHDDRSVVSVCYSLLRCTLMPRLELRSHF